LGPLEPLIPIFFFLTVGGVVVLRGPLGRALADRIAGRTARDGSVREAELERQVEDLQYRLTELEERVDFTERVLSSGREPRTLPREE
jgi:hypothetical protein